MTHPSKRNGEIEWRQLPWLPDYEISEAGGVRRTTKGVTRKLGHVAKGSKGIWGYTVFKLMLPNGTKKVCLAHRLVCEAFHGPPPSTKHQVAHWDGNGSNNHYTNLRWATSKENHADRRRHGRSGIGENNIKAKLTEQDVRNLRQRFTGEFGEIRRLAREYGVGDTAMSYIRNGKNWSHVR